MQGKDDFNVQKPVRKAVKSTGKKDACPQAREPEFDLSDSHGGER